MVHLGNDDQITSTHRGHGHLVAKGGTHAASANYAAHSFDRATLSGNHLHMVYGDHVAALTEACNFLNITPIHL